TLNPPLEAKYSNPVAWLAFDNIGLQRKDLPTNFLVVEATDRNGQRAKFSNIGGHVSAPGVSILSTTNQGTYDACPGTSQAGPHVAALATLLFELDPNKRPDEIADIIKSTALDPISPRQAPRVDALPAALAVSEQNLLRLADLTRDGRINIDDLNEFKRQYL